MARDYIVFIVDDDEAVRESLQALLESAGYATDTYDSGFELLEALDGNLKGCVLVDGCMPKMSGLEVQERLNANGSNIPVIVITGSGDMAMAVQAMKSGATDFLEKPFEEEQLFESVKNALSVAEDGESQRAISADVQRNLERLTERERDVMAQLVAGRRMSEIADELGYSLRTVEIYRARVMGKMGAYRLPQLMRMAFIAGMHIPDN